MAATMETLQHSIVDSNKQTENNFSFLPVMESEVQMTPNQTCTLLECPIKWFRKLSSIQPLQKTRSNHKLTYNNGEEKEHPAGCNISIANST
jgi:hypothetical protein